MMNKHIDMVRDFHRKHRFPAGIRPGDDPKADLVRVHLIGEELAELALAIADRDRVKIADALADLTYVVFGTAVTYDIPLQEVFEEVHRSNMTKAIRVEGDTRLRDKGSSYIPADIAGVLAATDGRKERGNEETDNEVSICMAEECGAPLIDLSDREEEDD